MVKFKESKIYLDFFYRFKITISVATVFLAAAAYFYQYYQPATTHQSLLLEMSYEPDKINQAVTLTDEAVSLLRTRNIHEELNLLGIDKVSVFKIGPVVLNIDVSGARSDRLDKQLNKLSDYAKGKFPLKQIGKQISYDEKTSEVYFLASGAGIGFFIGVFIALIKTYFKNY